MQHDVKLWVELKLDIFRPKQRDFELIVTRIFTLKHRKRDCYLLLVILNELWSREDDPVFLDHVHMRLILCLMEL